MIRRLRTFRWLPPDWSLRRGLVTFVPLPVAMTLYAVFAPRDSSLADAVTVSTLTAVFVTAALWVYFRFLRVHLGTKTGIAAAALGLGVVVFAASLVTSNCPTGTAARCSTAEAFDTAFAALLIPVAFALLIGLPYGTYQTIQTMRRLAKRTQQRVEELAGADTNEATKPVHRGRVTDSPKPRRTGDDQNT